MDPICAPLPQIRQENEKQEKLESVSHINTHQESGNYHSSSCASQILDNCQIITTLSQAWPWMNSTLLLLSLQLSFTLLHSVQSEHTHMLIYKVQNMYLHRCICIWLCAPWQMQEGMRTCMWLWSSYTLAPLHPPFLSKWLPHRLTQDAQKAPGETFLSLFNVYLEYIPVWRPGPSAKCRGHTSAVSEMCRLRGIFSVGCHVHF